MNEAEKEKEKGDTVAVLLDIAEELRKVLAAVKEVDATIEALAAWVRNPT